MAPPSTPNDSRTFHLLRQVKTGGLTQEQLAHLKLAESDADGKKAGILVVDDSPDLRQLTVGMLQMLGYENVDSANDGRAGLRMLRERSFDLVVLDIEMPLLDGFGVLTEMKKDAKLSQIPVIVASGLQELTAVVRCIELGAEDFLPKPVSPVLLQARLRSSLERRRLRELDRLRMLELQWEKELVAMEQEKSDRLLLNILPAPIAERLKQGERTIAERFDCVSVLFADLVEFTPLVSHTDPTELVTILNELFSRFDQLADRLGLEKIKTIGDCYLVVGGLPVAQEGHIEAIADMALGMLAEVAAVNRERELDLSVRIGLNCGPAVAGVIGRKKFAYDLWGATVNLASRMQSEGLPNRVHLPDEMRRLLGDKYVFTERGTVVCKGVGEVCTCFLDGRRKIPEPPASV